MTNRTPESPRVPRERRKESPVLAGAYVEAQDFSVATLGVEPDGDHHRRTYDLSVLSSL